MSEGVLAVCGLRSAASSLCIACICVRSLSYSSRVTALPPAAGAGGCWAPTGPGSRSTNINPSVQIVVFMVFLLPPD